MPKQYKLEARLHDTLKEKCSKEVSDTLDILSLDKKIKEDISLKVKNRNAKLYKEFMETKSGLRFTMLDVKILKKDKEGEPAIDNSTSYKDVDGQEKTFTHVNSESQNGIFDIDMNDFMRHFKKLQAV